MNRRVKKSGLPDDGGLFFALRYNAIMLYFYIDHIL